jgi:hypothetical protein
LGGDGMEVFGIDEGGKMGGVERKGEFLQMKRGNIGLNWAWA